jgi:thiol peroxidase
MTMSTQVERSGVITFKGNPMTLVGHELKIGDRVPDFRITNSDLGTVSWDDLSQSGTKAVLMIFVPSIDTSVCSLETGKFNRHVANLPAEKIKVATVSADTPFAQKRWATQEGITNLEMLSDYKDKNLANAFGVHIKELGLLTRAIYLFDKDGILRYIETVPEVTTEPDYDAVLRAAREVVGA